MTEHKQKLLQSRARSSIQSVKNQLGNTNRILKKESERLVKHIFELHSKFSMALTCFIFLFIGAPMGAIIRKGGFGYPILISIFFFILYIVMTIGFKNVAEKEVMSPVLAAWLPCIVLFPIGLWLTFKAMNDSKLLNTDRYMRVIRKVVDMFRREK